MNRYVWEQNDRLRFLPARFLLKASLILFVAPLGWMQKSIKTNNASVDTLRFKTTGMYSSGSSLTYIRHIGLTRLKR